MKKNNRSLTLYFRVVFSALVLLVLSAAAGCGEDSPKSDENTISEGARAVIETFGTSPNLELCNADMAMPIGLGVELSDEQKEKIESEGKKARDNWEMAIGKYFAPNGLDMFLNDGQAYYYLGLSSVENVETEVKNMELVEKNDLDEKVKVTVAVDGVDEQIMVAFRCDEDGLIYRVSVTKYTEE